MHGEISSAPSSSSVSWWSLLKPADIARAATPVVIGRPSMRLLGSLGHVLGRFLETRQTLLKHVEKHPADAAAVLKPWLAHAPPDAPALDGTGMFGCVLGRQEQRLHLQRLLMSAEMTATVRGIMAAGQALPEPILAAPPDANAAIWPALLRLPKLRAFWEQHLRSNVGETLQQVMPEAWLLDPAPLPPGAVVAGLDLPGWQAFPSVQHHSRRFALSPAWAQAEDFQEAWRLDVETALAQYPGQSVVLTAAPPADEEVIFALYQKEDKNVSLWQAMHLVRNATGAGVLSGVAAR